MAGWSLEPGVLLSLISDLHGCCFASQDVLDQLHHGRVALAGGLEETFVDMSLSSTEMPRGPTACWICRCAWSSRCPEVSLHLGKAGEKFGPNQFKVHLMKFRTESKHSARQK